MWQALRDELAGDGFELVTVGLDTLADKGCRRYMEAAEPTHPALIDQHHLLSRLFGVINIPSAFWVDEEGTIVRPAEPAPAPPASPRDERLQPPPGAPQRFVDMLTEARRIPNDAASYHAALRDWVANGAASEFALTPDVVIERSRPQNEETARAEAHFELASHLAAAGDHDAAVPHFREAHRLQPESWTFRRQAWSLEGDPESPLSRFWQGPDPTAPESWPYEGDWLSDIRRIGPENYNARFRP